MNQDTIQSTDNYALFGLLNTNRELYEKHVGSLRRKMEEQGNITEKAPILVNENMQIIDGQHRFAAATSIGLPIFYRRVTGLTVEDARQMNILNRNWTGTDYLHTYTQEGRRAYLDVTELTESYPGIPLSIILVYARGFTEKGIQAKFRRGEFEPFDKEQAMERLEKLTQLNRVINGFTARGISQAVIKMLRTPEYNHERMLRKLTAHTNDFTPYVNTSDNLRMLEGIYNRNMSEGRHVRFF